MTNAIPFSTSRRKFIDLLAMGLAMASVPLPRAFAQASGLSAMKIATIGAGREGGALGTLYAKMGHQVMFSSRHPEGLKDLVAAAGPTARAGTVAEAVAFGDIIFLVVPYSAVEPIGREFGAALAAKPLILDASNPIPRREGQAFVDRIASEGGPGIMTAKSLNGARVVRAFNAIGSTALEQIAHRANDPVGIPIAGDDPRAIDLADRLIRRQVSSRCLSAVWPKASTWFRARRSPGNTARPNCAASRQV